METIKKKTTCSLCGETGHNKRSCPKKPIEDITINDDIIEERIDISDISDTREILIDDLLDKQSYDIPYDIFKAWYPKKYLCKQKEIRYLIDRKLNKDSIQLYLEMLEDFDI
jgi:hypothetical protein